MIVSHLPDRHACSDTDCVMRSHQIKKGYSTSSLSDSECSNKTMRRVLRPRVDEFYKDLPAYEMRRFNQKKNRGLTEYARRYTDIPSSPKHAEFLSVELYPLAPAMRRDKQEYHKTSTHGDSVLQDALNTESTTNRNANKTVSNHSRTHSRTHSHSHSQSNNREPPGFSVIDVQPLAGDSHGTKAMLAKWRTMSVNYGWLHSHAADLFSAANVMITVPVVLLSITTGTMNLAMYRSPEADSYVPIASGIMATLAAAMTTCQSLLKFDERSYRHKTSANEFDRLGRDISVAILLDNMEGRTYQNLSEFLKECNDRFNIIMEKSPPVPEHLFKRLERVNNIYVPRYSVDTMNMPP